MEFKTLKIEDALAATNRQPLVLPEIPGLSEKDRNYTIDNFNLVAVVEAINQESNDGKPWEPDYNNADEIKYEPVFWISKDDKAPGGFVFTGSDNSRTNSATMAGSRFCFHSLAALRHAVRTFNELYLRVITKQK